MNSPNTETSAALAAGTQPAPGEDGDYWNALIDESEAAAFLGLARGTLANMRQAGRSARFIRVSSRCVRFRRADLRQWADERLRSSTSDPGPAEAA